MRPRSDAARFLRECPAGNGRRGVLLRNHPPGYRSMTPRSRPPGKDERGSSLRYDSDFRGGIMSRQWMRAAAIDRFGGPEVLKVRKLPVPEITAREVLIQLDTAGVGPWDAEWR